MDVSDTLVQGCLTVKACFSPLYCQINHYPGNRAKFCIWTNWQAVQTLPSSSLEATGLWRARPRQAEKPSFEWQPAVVSVRQCRHWGRLVCRRHSAVGGNEHKAGGQGWRTERSCCLLPLLFRCIRLSLQTTARCLLHTGQPRHRLTSMSQFSFWLRDVYVNWNLQEVLNWENEKQVPLSLWKPPVIILNTDGEQELKGEVLLTPHVLLNWGARCSPQGHLLALPLCQQLFLSCMVRCSSPTTTVFAEVNYLAGNDNSKSWDHNRKSLSHRSPLCLAVQSCFDW